MRHEIILEHSKADIIEHLRVSAMIRIESLTLYLHAVAGLGRVDARVRIALGAPHAANRGALLDDRYRLPVSKKSARDD